VRYGSEQDQSRIELASNLAVIAYEPQSQLNVDTIAGFDIKTLNVGAIPAIVLVDNHRMGLDFWIGKPTEETELQISTRLTSG
jgi:hypothetical protein